MRLTDAWRAQYEHQFGAMTVSPAKAAAADAVGFKINANRSIYEAISARTNGVPWYFIGALHYREADLDFTKFLGDGEPLNRATVNVPAHMGPFTGPHAFEDGAVAAIEHEGLQHITDWSLGSQLFHGEEYNGEGYHDRHMPSPYVFAGTSIYFRGEFDRDHHFNPALIDQRLGVAVILWAMQRLGFIQLPQPSPADSASRIPVPAGAPHQPLTGKGNETMTTATATAPASAPAPASSSSGFSLSSVFSDVVSAAKTDLGKIWTAVSGMFGSISGGGFIINLLTQINPSWTMLAVGVLAIAGTIVGAIASAYFLFTHISATNNATIAMAEKWINMAEGWLGQPAIDFSADNGPAATAATPPASTSAAAPAAS